MAHPRTALCLTATLLLLVGLTSIFHVHPGSGVNGCGLCRNAQGLQLVLAGQAFFEQVLEPSETAPRPDTPSGTTEATWDPISQRAPPALAL